MRVSDLFRDYQHKCLTDQQIVTLRTSCSQFIEESEGLPLIKNSRVVETFSKIKVRFHNKQNEFIDTFNTAFFEKHHVTNLHQRAIFASSSKTFITNEGSMPIYVFPKNGYKFLYCKEVVNSNVETQKMFEQLFEQFNDLTEVTQIMKDLLQYTYTDSALAEGIRADAEIILYNIPHYYAVKVDRFESYDNLLSLLS